MKSHTATHMATTPAQSAVVARVAPICVAQFNADAQRTVKLEELKAASSSQRSKIVMEQGWATAGLLAKTLKMEERQGLATCQVIQRQRRKGC